MHAQVFAEAASGRLPFWGGAICYQGDLKQQVTANGHAAPGLVRDRGAALATTRSASGPPPTCSRR